MHSSLIDTDRMEVLFFGGPANGKKRWISREVTSWQCMEMKRLQAESLAVNGLDAVSIGPITDCIYFFHEFVGEREIAGERYVYLIGSLDSEKPFYLGDVGLDTGSWRFAEYIVSLCRDARLHPHRVIRPGLGGGQ